MKESILRTLVPIIYALLIKTGVVEWLGVDDQLAANLVALVAAGLVYVVLRVLEHYQSQVGWLIGYAKQPVYALPAVAATAASKVNLLNQQVTEANTRRDEAGRIEPVVVAALIIAGALLLIFLIAPRL